MKKREKMNKLLIILIAIVVLIVGSVIGGLFYFGLLGNTELTNYAGNGVSFKYPADYNITEVNDNSTFLIAKNTKNPSQTFQISKSPVNGNIYHGTSLDEYFNTLNNDFKSRSWFIIAENETIDKSKAYSIDYNEKTPSNLDTVNGWIFIFDKNGIRYTIEFNGKGKQLHDISAIFQVKHSFKVL